MVERLGITLADDSGLCSSLDGIRSKHSQTVTERFAFAFGLLTQEEQSSVRRSNTTRATVERNLTSSKCVSHSNLRLFLASRGMTSKATMHDRTEAIVALLTGVNFAGVQHTVKRARIKHNNDSTDENYWTADKMEEVLEERKVEFRMTKADKQALVAQYDKLKSIAQISAAHRRVWLLERLRNNDASITSPLDTTHLAQSRQKKRDKANVVENMNVGTSEERQQKQIARKKQKAEAAAAGVGAGPKSRGRPKGSKNRTITEPIEGTGAKQKNTRRDLDASARAAVIATAVANNKEGFGARIFIEELPGNTFRITGCGEEGFDVNPIKCLGKTLQSVCAAWPKGQVDLVTSVEGVAALKHKPAKYNYEPKTPCDDDDEEMSDNNNNNNNDDEHFDADYEEESV